MNILTVILLAVFGITMLAVECFLIPGVGIPGVVGVLACAGSVWLAYIWLCPLAGYITLIVDVVAFGVILALFARSKTLHKMSLDTEIDSHVDLTPPGKKLDDLKSSLTTKN